MVTRTDDALNRLSAVQEWEWSTPRLTLYDRRNAEAAREADGTVEESRIMSNISRLLPRLTVNWAFMSAFLAAPTPCFALGMVEERGRACGFLAVRPGEIIPPDSTDTGFQFGHSLVGTAHFEVVHFGFAFYGFKTYNVLVNPNNPLVRTVLTTMVESGDYYFFALDTSGSATVFRSAIGEADVAGLSTTLPRIRRSTTTEAQYQRAVTAFEKNLQPPGVLLPWVCRDTSDVLDLTTDRLDLTPT